MGILKVYELELQQDSEVKKGKSLTLVIEKPKKVRQTKALKVDESFEEQ